MAKALVQGEEAALLEKTQTGPWKELALCAHNGHHQIVRVLVPCSSASKQGQVGPESWLALSHLTVTFQQSSLTSTDYRILTSY